MQGFRNFDDKDLKCNLYKTLYARQDMNAFAGAANSGIPDPKDIDFPSLEQIHDQVHTAVGGYPKDNATYGTFYWLDVSAFDPVFWMHHAMVDRMLTIFQVLYPDTWIRPQQTTSTWTIPEGPLIDGTVGQ